MNRTGDKLREECAVFGLYNNDYLNAGRIGYEALFAMQHRGQDGAGLACANGPHIEMHKGLGLVSDVFGDADLSVSPAAKSQSAIRDTQPVRAPIRFWIRSRWSCTGKTGFWPWRTTGIS